MPDNIHNVRISQNIWVDLYAATGIAVGTVLTIENSGNADVYLAVQAVQPDKDHQEYNIVKRPPSVTVQNSEGDLGAWAFVQGTAGLLSISSVLAEGFRPVTSSRLHDGFGNPIGSLKGAIDIHDADVHDVPVNELFHRHTGVSTALAATTIAGVTTSIQVDDGALFNNGDIFQIEETVDGITTIEVTFPTIITGGTTNTFTLDRPLDNAFGIGASVEVVTTNMAVNGSLVAPVIFQLIPDSLQEWHVVRFLLGMIHAAAADDSRFGDIAGGLQNGCVLRGFDGASGRYRTFTNWKTNSDIKMDMFDLTYTDKAGGGNFGSNGRGSIRDGTGAAPKLDGATGGLLELIVQDDLTTLIDFKLKGQGHIEGL